MQPLSACCSFRLPCACWDAGTGGCRADHCRRSPKVRLKCRLLDNSLSSILLELPLQLLQPPAQLQNHFGSCQVDAEVAAETPDAAQALHILFAVAALAFDGEDTFDQANSLQATDYLNLQVGIPGSLLFSVESRGSSRLYHNTGISMFVHSYLSPYSLPKRSPARYSRLRGQTPQRACAARHSNAWAEPPPLPCRGRHDYRVAPNAAYLSHGYGSTCHSAFLLEYAASTACHREVRPEPRRPALPLPGVPRPACARLCLHG